MSSLQQYHSKRRFEETREPRGRPGRHAGHRYVIQRHDARRLHYDFRLELDGVLKSWAVTREPSTNPSDKRLAVRTEDHPLEYARFEGEIPKGHYGAGHVEIWDAGSWEPVGDPRESLKHGKLEFRLHGTRLSGGWLLVRMRPDRNAKRENWLLIKRHDDGHEEPVRVIADETHQASEEQPSRPSSPRAKKATKTSTRVSLATDRGKLPEFQPLALATLVDAAPTEPGWIYEVKFDGYRLLVAAAGQRVAIYTRSGLDWTDRFPHLAEAIRQANFPGVLLDGEAVMVDDDGRSDFSELQQAIREQSDRIQFFVFDLLALHGKDLRARPLRERKTELQALLPEALAPTLRYSQHVAEEGAELLRTLCARRFEGIVAKRADAPYRAGRQGDWLKIKCAQRQEFVIIGYSPSDKDRPFSSLLLGVYQDGQLRYTGRVGSGYSDATLSDLARRFRSLRAQASPISASVPASVRRDAVWLRPELVAEIEFAEFTRDGQVRQARFLGLREDKQATAVHTERILPVQLMTQAQDTIAGVHLTHPDKVLYPGQGITKRQVAQYLERIAPLMLPHVQNRLLSLVRCPQGAEQHCFFQRHRGRGDPESLHVYPWGMEDKDRQEYLYIRDVEGLVATAQMGALELHIWGSRLPKVDQPDRLVFDLDPDPSVAFTRVRHAAFEMRELLEALGLKSFALLSGGKGVHVVVPVVPQAPFGWAEVKAFCKALAERMEAAAPDRYIANMSKKKRVGRIFVDYLRNDHHATAIAPYSVRAHAGAPIAWPVTWQELASVEKSDAVRITQLPDLESLRAWDDYWDVRQKLTAKMLAAVGADQ